MLALLASFSSAATALGLPTAHGLWTSISSKEKAHVVQHFCALGKLDSLQMLVAFGLNLTPLGLAAMAGHTAVVKALVRAGANKNIPEENPPILRAFKNRFYEIVGILVDAGAEIGRPGEASSGGNVLVWAASCGRLPEVKLLREAGADLDRAATELGVEATPLAAAVRSRRTAVVKYLLSAGASVNKPSMVICATPLHLAAEDGNLELVKYLVAAGGDVNCVAPNGFTPMILALKGGYVEVEKFLRKAGATVPSCQVPSLLELTTQACKHAYRTKGYGPVHLENMGAVRIGGVDWGGGGVVACVLKL